MESIKTVVNERRTAPTEQLTTGFNKVKSIDNRQLSIDRDKAIDRALEQTSDLISERFRPWYAGRVRSIGVARYLGIAADARRGRSPQKLFSYLLKGIV